MAIRKPAFITKQIRGGRPTVTRPYKWAPGIPSLAIEITDEGSDNLEKLYALGYDDVTAITNENGIIIAVIINKS